MKNSISYTYNKNMMDILFTSNNYKDTTTRLKFIGKIQPGEKINTKHYLSIVRNDWVTSFLRKFYNFESRTQSVMFINESISQTFQLIEQIKLYIKSLPPNEYVVDTNNILSNLFKDLVNSKIGITNIMQTYQDDKIIMCQLETIMENIDLFLQMNNVNI